MKNTNLEENINNYIENFLNSDEYKLWKENDDKLYTSKELIPYFEKKREYENNLRALTYGTKEYEDYLSEYFKYVNSLSSIPQIKQYLYSYQDIQKIKKIFEDELLEKLR